jgi:hypothetical protein
MDNEFRSSVEQNSTPNQEAYKSKPTIGNDTADNIVDLLSGGKSISELAESLNLNPELTQKVLMPLANMVQKYNVGQSVAQSKTGQTAGDLITVLRDVAPVIQGLTEYLAGQRKKLEDEDLAYLDAIKSAQSSSDFSDLFTDDMMTFGEEVEIEERPAPVDPRSSRQREVEETLGASLPIGWDPTQPIDWAEVLGEKPKTMGNNSVLGFESLEDIQAEADRLSGKITMSTDAYDLSKGLSLDASLVPTTGVFMSMDDLIAEAGLTNQAAADVLSEGSGGFNSEGAKATPQVQAKSVVTPVAPVALDEVSLDMDEFMAESSKEDSEEVMYLSDEEVEDLRAEGFVFEELDDEAE